MNGRANQTKFNIWRNKMFATEAHFPSASAVNTRMAAVFRNMFLAVMTSFAVSWYVATTPALFTFFFSGILLYVSMFLPLLFIFLVPVLLNAGLPWFGKHLVLHAFAASMGLSMAILFKVYTGASIFGAFAGAAALFGTLSAYGYFTKQNLDSIGKYAFVALIAIVIVSVINMFVGSSALSMLVSAISIPVFLALTAYDTQNIREQIYADEQDVEILGALTLYLDFINLFSSLLSLFGVKED
jgi:FtsH-binding integral membrane protein